MTIVLCLFLPWFKPENEGISRRKLVFYEKISQKFDQSKKRFGSNKIKETSEDVLFSSETIILFKC